MIALLEHLCKRLHSGQDTALALIVSQRGSAPRGAGSRLLADTHGLLYGTIGGGLAENEVLRACAQALQEGQSRLLHFSLTGEMAAKSEMICGGQMDVLIDPIMANTANREFFDKLRALAHAGACLLCTDISDPAHTIRHCWEDSPSLEQDDSLRHKINASLPTTALDKLEEDCVHIHRHEGHVFLLERLFSPARLIIAGGGHIARPTAQIAALAGFSVTVLDDRPEFSQKERFPWATSVRTVPNFTHCFAPTTLDYPLDSRSFIVIVTRGHLHDATVLAQALKTQAGYIGMIGSRRKREAVYTELRAQAFTEADIARVICPVGLPIHAETPEEIAVSIIAQCIEHRRGHV